MLCHLHSRCPAADSISLTRFSKRWRDEDLSVSIFVGQRWQDFLVQSSIITSPHCPKHLMRFGPLIVGIILPITARYNKLWVWLVLATFSNSYHLELQIKKFKFCDVWLLSQLNRLSPWVIAMMSECFIPDYHTAVAASNYYPVTIPSWRVLLP